VTDVDETRNPWDLYSIKKDGVPKVCQGYRSNQEWGPVRPCGRELEQPKGRGRKKIYCDGVCRKGAQRHRDDLRERAFRSSCPPRSEARQWADQLIGEMISMEARCKIENPDGDSIDTTMLVEAIGRLAQFKVVLQNPEAADAPLFKDMTRRRCGACEAGQHDQCIVVNSGKPSDCPCQRVGCSRQRALLS
jgi:hypothetical protein